MPNSRNWFVVAALISCVVWMLLPTLDNGFSKVRGEDKKPQAASKAPYVHTVIWYLREDAPKKEAEMLIADAHRLLAKIPSVRGLWIGRPAEKSTPELAQTDYQIGMMLMFDDYAGLKQYLEHKLHLEFRKKHAHQAKRIAVFDFIDREKLAEKGNQ